MFTPMYLFRYAHKMDSGRFTDIYKTKAMVRFCDGKVPKQMYKILLEEDNESGSYWGWYYDHTDGDGFSMIWASEAQFRICFPYGPEAEEKMGRGEIVRFNVVKEMEVESK